MKVCKLEVRKLEVCDVKLGDMISLCYESLKFGSLLFLKFVL